MGGIALKLLATWWKEILITLVVLAAAWYVWELHNTVGKQRVIINEITNANQVLTSSNKTLTDTVTANNKTIAELSKGADETKREFDKLNVQVEHQTQVLTKRLKDILSRKAPVTCDDTIRYLIEAAPTYTQ